MRFKILFENWKENAWLAKLFFSKSYQTTMCTKCGVNTAEALVDGDAWCLKCVMQFSEMKGGKRKNGRD